MKTNILIGMAVCALSVAFQPTAAVAADDISIHGMIRETQNEARTAAAQVNASRTDRMAVNHELNDLLSQIEASHEVVKQWSDASRDYEEYAQGVANLLAGCQQILAELEVKPPSTERLLRSRKKKADDCVADGKKKEYALKEIDKTMDSIRINMKTIAEMVEFSDGDIKRLREKQAFVEKEQRLFESMRVLTSGQKSVISKSQATPRKDM